MTNHIEQSPTSGLRLIASTPPGFRRITDPVELFKVLFDDIEMEDPRVPISSYVVNAKDELFSAIREGRPPQYYLYWHRILRYGFDWERSSDKTVRLCSINMLVFMGHIGQFTNRNPDAQVPLSLALEVLASVGETAGTVSFHCWKEHSSFSSTPDSMSRLPLQFDITIPGDRCGLDLSEWHRNSGVI